MRILKFGGSSVKSAECINNVIDIIYQTFQKDPEIAVVVSAFQGVTDTLINLGRIAASGSDDYTTPLENMRGRYLNVAQELLDETQIDPVFLQTTVLFKELSDALYGIMLIKEMSDRSLDLIMSYGEQLSATIIAAALKLKIPLAEYLDARKLIITNRSFGSAVIDEEVTYKKIKEYFTVNQVVPVITGFIASTSGNETTTLGRGGSDFTAAIIGAAMQADAVEIWTDVDGVMTADPRKVPEAFPIPSMTYQELMEMSHFGAKVVHPPTIAPAMHHKVPIWIKNSFNKEAPGTEVMPSFKNHTSTLIRGISSVDSIVLLRLEGAGMIGVCGVASRLFGALARESISVMIITQGSSEHSICFAVSPEHSFRAKELVDKEFALERRAGLVDEVVVTKDVSVVAVVGESMHESPGVSGRFFGALGKNGINIIAIAQGSSELNITCIVNRKDEKKALNVVHDEFFLSNTATIHLFILGVGLIGKSLLKQIYEQVDRLKDKYSLRIKVCGLANSKMMVLDPMGVSLDKWSESLVQSNEQMDVDKFITTMRKMNLGTSIFVDCTASDSIAENYASILNANISVVTPNKRANSASYASYVRLKNIADLKGVKYFYETNVGAGLPILSTLMDLQLSGDKIIKIESILSGTLSYIFNNYVGEITLKEIVKKAQSLGYTEPDPREDLNGMDVARKILILARECGYPLEIDDVTIEPFLPKSCFEEPSIDAFYETLNTHAKDLEGIKQKAESMGKCLRYIAKLENGKASVLLQVVGDDHPFHSLSGSDNIVAIYTERYCDNPLVIKGSGAGAEVTAGGVFADIIRIGKR